MASIQVDFKEISNLATALNHQATKAESDLHELEILLMRVAQIWGGASPAGVDQILSALHEQNRDARVMVDTIQQLSRILDQVAGSYQAIETSIAQSFGE